MAQIVVNETRHAYEVSGTGPHVTLLHTVGLSTRQGWRNQVPVFAQYFAVLTYDIRGLGKSERGGKELGVRSFAEDLHALLSSLGIGKTVLIGASLGGSIAQAFAAAHPEAVRGLVLVSTTCKMSLEGATRLRERNQRIRSAGMKVAVDAQIRAQFSEGFIRDRPETIDWYRSHYLANDPAAYMEIMEDQATLDLSEQIRHIRCPTLIVTGADDLSPVRGREPGESARLLHDSIPGSQLLVIPGARHYPHIDHPDLFNEAVLSFLNSIPI